MLKLIARQISKFGALSSKQCWPGQMHLAAWTGNVHLVTALVSAGEDTNNGDRTGLTALHLAVFNSHVDVVKTLLQFRQPFLNNATPDAAHLVNYYGWSAIHFAVSNDDLDVLDVLFEAGANGLIQDETGYGLIHLFAFNGSINVIRKLIVMYGVQTCLAFKGTVTPMHAAAMADRGDIISVLNNGGFDVSARDEIGQTPLHYAARFG